SRSIPARLYTPFASLGWSSGKRPSDSRYLSNRLQAATSISHPAMTLAVALRTHFAHPAERVPICAERVGHTGSEAPLTGRDRRCGLPLYPLLVAQGER